LAEAEDEKITGAQTRPRGGAASSREVEIDEVEIEKRNARRPLDAGGGPFCLRQAGAGDVLCAGFAEGGLAVAAGLENAAAAAQEAVEFVDQEIGGFVGVFGGDARDQIGAADFDVTFGDENFTTAGCVVLDVDADAINAGFVAE
jgi:hypothetical protein